MPLFTVDSDKCAMDGLCAAECPAGCIVFENGALPAPHEKKQAYCLECGHCVAVCPTGAIALERFPTEAVRQRKDLRISQAQGEQFLRARRSVRTFKETPVSRAMLTSLLQTAEYCPSAHNARPTRWAVADSLEKVALVANSVVDWMRREAEGETAVSGRLHLPGIVRAWDNGLDLVCRNAPALAVAYGPQKGIMPREDAVVAVTYLDLAASSVGLGGCWCGYVIAAATYDRKVTDLLGVPEDCAVYGALLLGRPVRSLSFIPPRPEPTVRWI